MGTQPLGVVLKVTADSPAEECSGKMRDRVCSNPVGIFRISRENTPDDIGIRIIIE